MIYNEIYFKLKNKFIVLLHRFHKKKKLQFVVQKRASSVKKGTLIAT